MLRNLVEANFVGYGLLIVWRIILVFLMDIEIIISYAVYFKIAKNIVINVG